MNPENNPSGAQADASHVNAAAAPENVGSGTPSASPEISLSELNSLLGKTFPTKDAALKSLKDTQSYVGMKKEDIEKEVLARTPANTQDTTALAKQLEEMRKDNFYRDNPTYNKPEIKALIDKLGANPADVINSPDFKPFFEKVQGFDEVQKLRTVLDSNPRLATSRDALTKAADSMKESGRRTERDESAIADAVLATLQ